MAPLIVFFAFSFWLTLGSTSGTLAGGAVCCAGILDFLHPDRQSMGIRWLSSTNQRARTGEISDCTMGTGEIVSVNPVCKKTDLHLAKSYVSAKKSGTDDPRARTR